MPRLSSLFAAIAVLFVAGIQLTGCGGKSGSATSPASTPNTSSAPSSASQAGSTVKLAADPSGQLKFDVSQLTAKAGKVTIDFTNDSQVGHNVQIEGPGDKDLGGTSTITGSSTTATVTIPAGTYTFYCSVPGHRQAGMQGKLIAK
jgi:plastocyanin